MSGNPVCVERTEEEDVEELSGRLYHARPGRTAQVLPLSVFLRLESSAFARTVLSACAVTR